MPIYFIQPYNEGQELNYTETYRGTEEDARQRAMEMEAGLRRILKDGTITVKVVGEEV